MAVVWRAEVTGDMVKDLSPDEIQYLIDSLDQAVEAIVSDFNPPA